MFTALQSSPIPASPLQTDPIHAVAASSAWEAKGACANQPIALVDVFFSDEPVDIAAAKAFCASCGVLDRCLESALDRGEQFGVWGGQLFIDGSIHLTKRGRGRPPSSARQSDLIPLIEVPVHLRERVDAITEIGNGFSAESAA